MKNLGIILILSTIIFWGCEDPLKQERTQTYGEVMAIHDEMMPQVRHIRGAQTRLESMMKNAAQQKDSLNLNNYKTAFQQLETADQAMTEWMQQFSAPSKDTPDAQAIEYLKKQKTKVATMKKVMITNMDNARKVIDF